MYTVFDAVCEVWQQYKGTSVLGCSSVATIKNFLNLYYSPYKIIQTACTVKGMFLNVIQKAAR